MAESRYILVKDNTSIQVIDTLHATRAVFIIDGICSIGLTRSNLEDLQKQLKVILKKP